MPAPNRNAVTFSEFSNLAVITQERAGAKSAWYSSEDRTRFSRQVTRDARQISRYIDSTTADDVMTPEQLYECVGIEMFISRGLAGHIKDTRRRHTETVLREQRRQLQQGGSYDIEKLRRASEKSSHWSKERAMKLATGYSKLLDCD